MFGYIKPYKPEMKMMEFETYKAVYCGLCKQLGKGFGPFARFTLSYDFAFLSLLALGVANSCPGYKRQSCAANPLKKKPCLCMCDESRFSASAAMTMFYYKIKDNYQDSGIGGKIVSVLLLPYAGHARKKAARLYPEMDAIISREMEKQRKVEQETGSVDAAAEPSARALAEISRLIPAGEADRKVLERLCYLTGRWVYLMDALDDLEDDLRDGCFNPYLRRFGITRENDSLEEVKEYAKGMIRLTAGELSNTYELLGLNRFKPILDNIIYLGMPEMLRQILAGETKKKKKEHAELFSQ